MNSYKMDGHVVLIDRTQERSGTSYGEAYPKEAEGVSFGLQGMNSSKMEVGPYQPPVKVCMVPFRINETVRNKEITAAAF